MKLSSRHWLPLSAAVIALSIIVVSCGSTTTDLRQRSAPSKGFSQEVIRSPQWANEKSAEDGAKSSTDLYEYESDVAQEVTFAVTALWGRFRDGQNDLFESVSARCQTLPNAQTHLISEMRNLRAFLHDEVGPVKEIVLDVLRVDQHAPGVVEATTRLLYGGAAISNPGTQRLVFEGLGWRPDNCDARELKIAYECDIAFGEEHRGKCITFWREVVKPSGCDSQNPDFVSDFAVAAFGPRELTPEEWMHFAETCGKVSPDRDYATQMYPGSV